MKATGTQGQNSGKEQGREQTAVMRDGAGKAGQGQNKESPEGPALIRILCYDSTLAMFPTFFFFTLSRKYTRVLPLDR